MAFAEKQFSEARNLIAQAWWSLWLIYSKKLYQVAYQDQPDLSALEQWIGDLKTSGWGPSRSTFFDYMAAIARWIRDGHSEGDIHKFLASPSSTALIYDEKQLRDRHGNVLPGIAKTLATQNTTLFEVTRTAAQLGPGEARQFIQAFTEQDIYYIVSDSIIRKGNKTNFKIRHEHTRKGMVAEYSITMTGVEVAENGHRPRELPPEIVNWMLRGKQ